MKKLRCLFVTLVFFILSCEPIETNFNCLEIIEGSKLWITSSNQGLTSDGTHYYTSTTHTQIEKRRVSDNVIVATNGLTSKYGGLFYDIENEEILTAAGIYNPPYAAYVNKLRVSDLASTEEIDLSDNCFPEN